MPSKPRLSQRLETLTARLEPGVRREIEAAFTRLQRELGTAAFERAVTSGRFVQVLRSIDRMLPAFLEPAMQELTEAAQASAKVTAEFVPSMRVVNPDAVEAASNRATARLVTRITRETRQGIRVIITASIRDGIPPRTAARQIRSIVGLTPRQARAAKGYGDTLRESGVSGDRLTTAIGRYANKLRRQRAETIARTEIISASRRGQKATWTEAIRRGLLSEDVQKRWIASSDACVICKDFVDESPIPIDALFGGEFDGPPGHPNCRCTLALANL